MSLWLYAVAGAIGGGGALARFLLDGLISARTNHEFPVGTLVVNLSGSLLLGLCVGMSLRGDALVIVGTGALASYTTFSTWMFESQRLTEDGQFRLAALNFALSAGAGVVAAALGRAVVQAP